MTPLDRATEISNSHARTTLFDISELITDLKQELEAIGNDPQAAGDLLEAYLTDSAIVQDQRNQKLDGYCTVLDALALNTHQLEKQLEQMEVQYKLAIAPLKKQLEQNRTLSFRLHSFLVRFFQEQGLKKVETTRYKVTRGKSGGKPRVRVLVEPEQLPPHCQRISVAANLDQVRMEIEQRGDRLLVNEQGTVLAELEPKLDKITITAMQ